MIGRLHRLKQQAFAPKANPMGISIGKGWEELLERLRVEPGMSMLLGATDTGKSTLARYLIGGLTATGGTVALVDADVGQSALCLPGTVGMRLFRAPADMGEYRCEHFIFLGSANPSRVVPPLLEATKRLAWSARALAPQALVDTTGLVGGTMGIGLKLAKIRVLRPDHIIALQREGECEAILERLDGVAIHRLHPHPDARVRSQETRNRSRIDKLKAYFAPSHSMEHFLDAREIRLYRFGVEVSIRHWAPAPGMVIGLDRGGETLGLGLVTEADKNGITFLTPLPDISRVKRVALGDILLENAEETRR